MRCLPPSRLVPEGRGQHFDASLGMVDTLPEGFTVHASHGIGQTIAVTINGANDAPTTTGGDTGAVTENAVTEDAGALSATI